MESSGWQAVLAGAVALVLGFAPLEVSAQNDLVVIPDGTQSGTIQTSTSGHVASFEVEPANFQSGDYGLQCWGQGGEILSKVVDWDDQAAALSVFS